MTSMTNRSNPIRPLTRADLPAIKQVIASTDLFPPDLLDDMVPQTLGEAPGAGEPVWLTYADPDPVAVLFAAPEAMTDGTWNLYLLAVHASRHSKGIGQALVAHVETQLRAAGVRVLLVETSGGEGFARTRTFYAQCGFVREARIREFYAAGEDKIVFWKAL
ncbi:MAG: GNAT family N-acetyltransferase [Devosiaceae bacterium]|nr:GNAT family N-acetyltransferase [Devosiaceae bacterium MH13]